MRVYAIGRIAPNVIQDHYVTKLVYTLDLCVPERDASSSKALPQAVSRNEIEPAITTNTDRRVLLHGNMEHQVMYQGPPAFTVNRSSNTPTLRPCLEEPS